MEDDKAIQQARLGQDIGPFTANKVDFLLAVNMSALVFRSLSCALITATSISLGSLFSFCPSIPLFVYRVYGWVQSYSLAPGGRVTGKGSSKSRHSLRINSFDGSDKVSPLGKGKWEKYEGFRAQNAISRVVPRGEYIKICIAIFSIIIVGSNIFLRPSFFKHDANSTYYGTCFILLDWDWTGRQVHIRYVRKKRQGKILVSYEIGCSRLCLFIRYDRSVIKKKFTKLIMDSRS